MKQSGIDWIGEIPDDWKISKAKTILRNKSIKNHPESEVLSLYRDLGIVPKNSRDDNHNVTSDDTASYKFVQKGELVLNKMKTWQGSLAVSDYEGIVSPAYYVCEFINQEIDKKYIHYLLRNKMYAQEFERLSTGLRVGQWDLNIDDFLNTPIVYPPKKATQQRIAEYLDSKCAQIDSIIEESKKSIEENKAWKQSVIFEAVTGKNLNGKKQDSGIEWIGEIPEGWEVRKIRTIANIIRGGSPRPIDEFMTNSESGFNWIKIGDTVKGSKYITSTKAKIIKEGLSKTRIVNPGDLILTNSMSFGEPYILKINGCIHDGWVAFSQIIKSVNKEFLYYFLRSSFCNTQFQLQVDGGVVQNLNIDKIKSTTLFLPPLSEQEAIAKMLDSKCAQIDSLIAEKESLIADLTEYKKSLIFEVVTGKRSV